MVRFGFAEIIIGGAFLLGIAGLIIFLVLRNKK